MTVMTTAETAKLLGVSSEAVRKMLKTGRLEQTSVAGRTILIDAGSAHRVHREGKRSGRLWAQRTAWAALSLLSGAEVSWLSASELWRLRKRLASLSAEELHQLARNRATSHRYRGGEAAKQKLSKVVAVTGIGALEDPLLANTFGLASGTGTLEGYARTGFIEKNVRKLGLREDPAGDILIRELDFVQPLVSGHLPIAAIAVDLMDSLSTRERSAGRAKLEELLHAI
ncbi:helix-turn-helix domain-containing protein [Glutamicibacter sp. MNS18]|uniref:helix-turn-helix domain-containing protein n=1 Tax=Glutamicibacter sp. MNS18 TaxID=2989817 RepID=UPI0022354A62|nr:helix-turn-helix domain-containing protein [Glutamicibacter sp. MNS18]MCW4466312.1 helix-turn-helix domain-containing protein [Glutamicibacter sp. MNS18]